MNAKRKREEHVEAEWMALAFLISVTVDRLYVDSSWLRTLGFGFLAALVMLVIVKLIRMGT